MVPLLEVFQQKNSEIPFLRVILRTQNQPI